MVSELETIPSRLFMTSEPSKEELLKQFANLKEEVEELRKENQRLRAKLRWYEGPHTPPSKDQSNSGKSSSSSGEDDDEEPSGFSSSTELVLKKGPSLSMLVFMPEMESLCSRVVADFCVMLN